MAVPPVQDAQFASYRHTSAKTPLSPVLTSLFHVRRPTAHPQARHAWQPAGVQQPWT